MNISDKVIKMLYCIAMIFLVAMIFIWMTGETIFEGLEWEAQLFVSYTIIAIIAMGVIFLIYLGKMYKLSTSTGKIWLLIGLGMLGWLIGEIIYTYYDLYTEETPFPSIGDAFYLIAYLPFAIGLIMQMKLLEIKLPNLERVIVLISYVAACVFVYFAAILPIQQAYGLPIPDDVLLEVGIAVLYPILDLVLLFCVLVVFFKLRHGKINIAWILLLIGILLTIIADITFNYVENVLETESLFELYDLMFLAGYLFILISALSVINIMTKTFDSEK